MASAVPGGRVVRNDLTVRLCGDPAKVFAAVVATAHYRQTVAGLELDLEAQDPIMLLDVDGSSRDGYVEALYLPRRTLVVSLLNPSDNTITYFLVREHDINAWAVSTKLLVLPFNDPDEWGDGDKAIEQRFGRILMFAGMANVNDWFLSLPR